jgi:hypothetical protein
LIAGEARFEINAPPASDLPAVAISPDGQMIVYNAISEGRADRGWY